MSQTYYFKLPMFIDLGDSPREAVIEFDDVDISTTEITTRDVNAPQNVIFNVNKEDGSYVLKVISPHVDPYSVLVIDDIWMSMDNVNWFSAIVNGISSNSPDKSYGFDPAKGAYLFGEIAEVEFNISLSASTFANFKTAAEMLKFETDEELLEKFSGDSEMVEKAKQAKALLTARGYN